MKKSEKFFEVGF